MACIYKGHKFNSELELDDFLLENGKFESTLGDIVFSRTAPQNAVSSKLSTIAKDTAELRRKYKEWEKSNKITYNDLGDESFEQPPFIGVNKFLSGLTNEEGKLLFPEFRENEYWDKRYAQWKEGNFNKDELDEIEELGYDKNNPPKLVDRKICDTIRDKMKERWEAQAKSGTAIHNVLQLCFTKVDGTYVLDLSKEKRLNYINTHLDKDNLQYLNADIIEQAILHASNVRDSLIYKLGDGLLFYPEFVVSQDTNVIKSGQPTKLLGIIDLLVIDKQGRPHILDYKTSVHDYSDFIAAKQLSYSYQLATYQRMLQKHGINTYEGSMFISPIKLNEFRKENGKYIYSSISSPGPLKPIGNSVSSDRMWENIDEFMPAPAKTIISAEKVGQTVFEMMSKWFPDYSDLKKETRDTLIKRLKKMDKLVPNDRGIFTFPRFGKGETPITASSEAEFVDKVLKYIQGLPAKRLRYTSEVKKFLKESIRNGINNTDFPSPIISSTDGETTWIRDTLSKYCDGNWEVEDNDITEAYGIIIMCTKDGVEPKQKDFIRVSTNILTDNYRSELKSDNPLKSRAGLTGTYEPDVAQKSKSNSLMVEAVNGNIELMETMLIINQLSGLQGYTIGNIQVVNPIYANGMKMSNEELLYCFNELNKHDPVEKNNIGLGDKEIKFAAKYELLLNELSYIVYSGEHNEWKDDYMHLEGVKLARPIIDQAINGNTEEKINAINRLISELESIPSVKARLSKTYTSQSDLQSKEISLYNAALIAKAQLQGINFRQQLRDHDKWLESLMIHVKGISGSMIDNPGNLDSETLNLVTKLVTEAYQNTRDDMQRVKTKIQKLVAALKKEKQFGIIKENTVGNQASLYSKMYKVSPNGDFVFVNPNTLEGAEKEFLENALYMINKNRFPGRTDEELRRMQENDDIKYYRVPLSKGGLDSLVSTEGMMKVLRDKLSFLIPAKAIDRIKSKIKGVLNAEEEAAHKSSQILFKMSNDFDRGEGDDRLDIIKQTGIENYEHNLETLLLKHVFAYSVKDNIDAVFPMIKAAMIHISSQGAIRNLEFTQDIEYLKDYINNKILNKSIVDPKNEKFAKIAGLIKSSASKLTLAFAPVQALYQPLQGLWTDISLMIRKPDGKDSFTFNHFKTSLKLVYSDLAHFSETPTICSAINETYGINDMDMNTYVNKISSGKRGLWNFDNLAYKFSSRPDYYNRMTIFVAQMLGDGCLEAHSINSKGELVYDWTKDKRFSKYAAAVKSGNGDSSDPEIAEQRSRYYAVAQQFVTEHAKMPNGSEFKLNMKNPMDLPRAYTSREAESMKSLGDDIYGYYSHEKKSLVMSTCLGAMWLQFKTYWSGKKNQYLQSGGVRLRGKWEHYSEKIKDPKTGEWIQTKYYYQVDDAGNVLFDEPPLTELEMKERHIPLIAPFIQWKGIWQEGIILTLSDMAKQMVNQRSIIKGWNSKWNEQDEMMRNVYRSNLKQIGYDLTMFVLGGVIMSALLSDWLDELLKENRKNRDLSTSTILAAANIAVMSVKSSFLDFNFIESVGSPVGQWTPFSIEWGGRTFKNWWKVAVGDEDFWDGVVNSSGGLKQIKPLLDTIKPDIFKTEREGGTLGVKK